MTADLNKLLDDLQRECSVVCNSDLQRARKEVRVGIAKAAVVAYVEGLQATINDVLAEVLLRGNERDALKRENERLTKLALDKGTNGG